MAAIRKIKSVGSKTKRIVGKKRKNEPKFKIGFKSVVLVSVIIGALGLLIFAANWRVDRNTLYRTIRQTQEKSQVDLNKINYLHDQKMRDLNQSAEKLKAEIDDLSLQIEMLKGEGKVKKP